ncbi:MAG TPA: DNA primase [Firmicutes bacterium]|nr:DNA primase [Bacillota bacterium]
MNRGIISERFVEEVRAASDIVDVISDYVRLKKVGQNFVGLCPFHSEDTPSFTVNRERQMFYCFGCNVGGDVFEFIKKREMVDFPESVRLLAERARLPVPSSSPAHKKRQLESQTLYYAGELAQQYFQSCLQHRQIGAEARAYLENRGIDAAVAEKFGLGFAPERWEGVIQHLKKHGVSEATIVKAGLAIPRPRGSGAYDRFRGRIMFPIRDFRGRVVAFGGRVLGPGEPKYLNSPETPIYRKSRLLYALDLARSGIERENAALIVEGYLDVLACHQHGFDFAVASLGTALTSEQLSLLKRFTKHMFIAYDADKAGQTATVRGLQLARQAGCQLKVLLLPEGKDPDDVIRVHGPKAFATLIEQALHVPAYYFQRLTERYDISTLEGRLTVAKAMVPHLAGIENLIEREEYTKMVAEELKLSQEALRAEIQESKRVQQKSSYKEQKTKAKSKPSLLPATYQAETGALIGLGSLFLTYPETRSIIAASIPKDHLSNLPQAVVLKTMLALFEQGSSDFSLSGLAEMLPDQQARDALAQLAVQTPPVGDTSVLIADFAGRLELFWVQKEIQSLRREINSRNRAGKNEDSANLIRRLADLHCQEVSLKQPSQGRNPMDGWKEGGTRHAEKG